MSLDNLPEPTDADLFALLEEAKSESAPRPRRTALDLDAELRALFHDPRNYCSAGHVTLVERNSQSLIGTFEVFQHIKRPDVRRFIRVSAPAASQVEYVEGDHWLSPLARDRARGTWKAEERITRVRVEATLSSGLTCDECDLLAVENDIGLIRLDLAAPALFRALDGLILLSLPVGIDLLEELTRDTKIAVRRAIDHAITQEQK